MCSTLGIAEDHIAVTLFVIHTYGRTPGIVFHIQSPAFLAGFCVQGNQSSRIHGVRAGNGIIDHAIQIGAGLAQQRCRLDTARHAIDGMHRIRFLPKNLSVYCIQLVNRDCALGIAILGPVQRRCGIDVTFRLIDLLEHRGRIGIVLGVLGPDQFHGIEVDTEEHASVFGNIQEVIHDIGAGFISAPVSFRIGAACGIPGQHRRIGSYRQGACGLIVDSIEFDCIKIAVFAGPNQSICFCMNERCRVKGAPFLIVNAVGQFVLMPVLV